MHSEDIRFDKIDATLADHTSRLDRLLDENSRQFTELFALLNEKFAAIDARFDYERRLTDLRFEEMRSDMRAFKEEMRDQGSRLKVVEETSADHDTRINILEARR